MRIFKLLLAAMGTTVVLGVLVVSASAREISYESQTFRFAFREVNFSAAGRTTRCQLTLEGSLHARNVPKTAGSLLGFITAATAGPCTSGSFTVLRETLPWHYRISGFEGNLPAITSIIWHATNVSLRIREAGGLGCLIRSTTAQPLANRTHINPVTSSAIGVSQIGTIRTGGECFGVAGEITSDSPVPTVLNSALGFHVRLI